MYHMTFARCNRCKKIVCVVEGISTVPTYCCGEEMTILQANSEDGAHEKHVPVVKIEGDLVTVNVGEVDHPMLDVHYIQWISLRTNLGYNTKILFPGAKPQTQFRILENERVLEVVAYCNLHGLYSVQF